MIVAQVTDIHAAPDNDNLSRLDRALAWLDAVGPDVLVVSGDLVDEGWRAGYEAIAARLGGRAYRSLVLPGNADDRSLMRAAMRSEGWIEGAAGALHAVATAGGVRLVGVDAGVAGSAAGDIRPHLPWLEAALSAPGGEATIVVLHHHVVASGIAPIDAVMCRGAADLATLLAGVARRPLALCSGHVHRPMASTLAGVPAYVCGSICPANPLWLGSAAPPPADDPPALMIHRAVDGVLVSGHVSV